MDADLRAKLNSIDNSLNDQTMTLMSIDTEIGQIAGVLEKQTRILTEIQRKLANLGH